ncbi:HD domain-containing protein [Orenia marismortui]|uniref:HD domain-containing protein n=1 Tax=Orenia marismortui TaxID=46469 RepID=A0A4R8HQ17_9FIRM|nr:HD domain-containing protein [Orenia marismortui]TDX59021.1 HD domain-containing protein [Orenia marismortui]
MNIFKPKELAKSKDFVHKKFRDRDNMSLEQHSYAVFKIVTQLLEGVKIEEEKKKRIQLSAYLHDIGKKDERFQKVLSGESENYLKHETKSLNYIEDIKDNWGEILDRLNLDLEYSDKVLEEILTFAVSHHGLFFLSKNKEDEYEIKKKWTEFSLEETSRITLVDLLFEYHPAGGFIVLADLIHSYSLAKGIKYEEKLKELKNKKSILEFINDYFEEIEAKEDKENRGTEALKEILKLTLGGVERWLRAQKS